jgi:hypothetical protein
MPHQNGMSHVGTRWRVGRANGLGARMIELAIIWIATDCPIVSKYCEKEL